jgi:hypothetical protein
MQKPADERSSTPRAAAPQPGTAEFTAQRQRLAQLIGRLMARRWLRQHLSNHDPATSPPQSPRRE